MSDAPPETAPVVDAPETVAELLAFSVDWWYQLLAIAGLIGAAFLAILLCRVVLTPALRAFFGKTRTEWDDILFNREVAAKLSWLGGAAVLYYGPDLLARWIVSPRAQVLLQTLANVFMILSVTLAVGALLNAINQLYRRWERAKERPIKGYLQVVKLLVYLTGGILIVATLLDKDPVVFLTGLGAMTAVLLLVFKDTILGLVASIQIASNDMLRLGDWLEMPSVGADGEIIDIALHTVKVQNWDKTITSIPTHRLISDSFKNWRGMTESGGRRVKRAIAIDMGTVRFLDEEEVERFGRFELLREYIAEKQRVLAEHNAAHAGDGLIHNARRLTNLGTLRAWITAYLRARPDIHTDGFTFLIRQLQPGDTGLPIELYLFTKTTAWAEYEGIQADIIDHILAMLPEFGLRAFQRPAGGDLQALRA